MAFIHPLFGGYAEKDPDFAEAMTRHLYEDPDNRLSWDPADWRRGPQPQFVTRTLTFEDVPATLGANSSTTTSNLLGGRNYVLFGRSALVQVGAGTDVLPNELTTFFNYRESLAFGQTNIEEGPLDFVFGSRPAFPVVLMQPILGMGRMAREYYVENNSGSVATVILSFQLAVLDTGR